MVAEGGEESGFSFGGKSLQLGKLLLETFRGWISRY
jgi:hypothetical protein